MLPLACVCALSGQVTIWRWCSTGKHSHPTPIIPYFPRGHPISGLEIRELRNDPRNKLNRPDLSILLFICLSASLKTKLFCEISSILEVDNIKKQSNSARRPQFFKLTAPKTKQFQEISSILEVDNIKNKAILRDFLIFRS